jgi:hypothetical protein
MTSQGAACLLSLAKVAATFKDLAVQIRNDPHIKSIAIRTDPRLNGESFTIACWCEAWLYNDNAVTMEIEFSESNGTWFIISDLYHLSNEGQVPIADLGGMTADSDADLGTILQESSRQLVQLFLDLDLERF